MIKVTLRDRIFAALALPAALVAGYWHFVRAPLAERVAGMEERLAALKAAGEDNNAKLVAAAFQKRGKKARYASPKDTGMVLEGEAGNATLNPESYKRLARAFSDFEGIVVYPGFFGYRADGSVATFPRGGSDITGSITPGKRADLILTHPGWTLTKLPYLYQTPFIRQVFLGGQAFGTR